MKFDTKKSDDVLNRLTGVFGVALGVFLSRLIVTLTPDKQATLVNWLIAASSTGLIAVLGGKGWLYSLTTGSLLGMAGNTVVTGGQALLQTNNVVAMPQTKEDLTMSKKLQMAIAGYPVNAISEGLKGDKAALRGDATYDASLWDKYRDVAQRERPKAQMAGFAVDKTAIAGW